MRERIQALQVYPLPIASAAVCAGLILPATPAYAATPHKIDNLGAGKCLSNNSSGYAVTENCNASDAKQEWQINAHIQPTFNGPIYNQWKNGNGKCLGLSGGTGPNLTIGPCAMPSDESQFFWGPGIAPANPTQMVNALTGSCVGLQGSSTAAGTHVILGACNNNSPTQQWQAQ
jgi:hypothetical protein